MKTTAYSNFLSIIGRIQEGIRELDVLKDKRDVNICSTMALMFAHKHSQSVGEFFSNHLLIGSTSGSLMCISFHVLKNNDPNMEKMLKT